MYLKSASLVSAVPRVIIEYRAFDESQTLLETRFDSMILDEIPLSQTASTPFFDGKNFYIFSHWTINGVLQDPTSYPDVHFVTGDRKVVTAWWLDAGTVWPRMGNGPRVEAISVHAVSATKGPLLKAVDENPLVSVVPPNAWSPPGGRSIDTSKGDVRITAKGTLESTQEIFDVWYARGTPAVWSPTVDVAAQSAGRWLAFYRPPARRPFEPPHISKWPPPLFIDPAGQRALTYLTAVVTEDLVEISREVELLRRRLNGEPAGKHDTPQSRSPEKKR